MATPLRFLRGLLFNYNQNGGNGQFMKLLYEFWGYCVNGTSALQTPGGFANTQSVTYSISAATNATPIVITTTTTHSLVVNQQVVITGVTGNTAANGTWQVGAVTATTFTLIGLTGNSVGNGGYTGGGTVFTTAFAAPLAFTEGTPVLAVGNDGYTAPQVSSNIGGNAFFTTTVNNPFTGTASSLTINGATNYQTTIAAGSNGANLPQSTINVVSTVPANTTISASSNNVSLPTATINVISTTGFPSSGYIFVQTSEGLQQVNYTGITATTFTGCSGGIGSMITGNTVNFTFAPSGTINVTTSNGPQVVTYNGITPTSLLNCSGGTGTMSTGGAVIAPIMISTTTANSYVNLTSVVISGVTGNTNANATWIITTPTYPVSNSFSVATTSAFQSNGATLPQATVNANTAAPFTTTTAVQTLPLGGGNLSVASTAPASTTLSASSNATNLPQATINVSGNPITLGFPTSGYLNVSTTAVAVTGGLSNGVSLPTSTINVGTTAGFPSTGGTIQVATTTNSTTIAAGSNGASLPGAGGSSTINVASTTGFPTSGFIFVQSSTGTQLVGYTNTTGTTFTGCTGGSGTMSTGGVVNGAVAVTYTGTTSTTFTGCSGGTGTMFTGGGIGGGPFPQTVTYTGLTATSFTGASGGTGTMFTGNAVNNTGFVTTFPASGSCYVNTTNGAQLITYGGVTATSLTNVNGGTGNTSVGGSVFTAFSPASNYTSIAAGSNGQSLPQSTINVASTTIASTTIAAASNGQSLPQTIINVASTSGFPAFGSIFVTTSGGVQLVSYTGITSNTFTGCIGGTGSMSTGATVTAGFPSAGFIYVLTPSGYQVVNYTGTTGTSFTGCTGGTGTMSTGNPVFIGMPPSGTVNVQTSTGSQVVSYTGTTATTFTGASGGTGTMSTGNAVTSPIFITTSTQTPLTTNQNVAITGVVGTPFANGSFNVTMINNSNFALQTSLNNGGYVSGGTVTDHSNFVLNGSIPLGTFTGSGTAAQSNMVGKILTIWKPNSGTTEDSLYVITAVVSPNTLQINLNTGGTPDPTTLHPSFNQRSNINYRVVDCGLAGVSLPSTNCYMVMQFNPGAIGLNPGQANSQVMVGSPNGVSNSSNMTLTISPGGNWNGITFPVTGNPQIDATSTFGSQSGNQYNGIPATQLAQTMWADPAFFAMHFKDVNSGDGSSYMHVEIPTRLYPSSTDTNPVAFCFRGGVFNGTVFTCGTGAGVYGGGFFMKDTTNTIRAHRMLSKALAGDGGANFGSNLTDIRLAFNSTRGTVLASDGILSLPGVTNQFSLGRVRMRTMKFTSTVLPLYHRFGTAGGAQFIQIVNGIAILWDNTIIPQNLFFII